MKIKHIFLLTCGLASLHSCDVMDTKPFESYSEELIWSSKETADAFVVKSYDGTLSKFVGGSASWESLTPNGSYCDQVENAINTTATETGIDAYTNYGFGNFNNQRKCNLILEQATNSKVLSESYKKTIIAEGHFLRGILWYDMTRKMGRFVPIKKVLDKDSKEEFKTPLTANEAESYSLIMEELKLAIEGLPEESAVGRVNKYVALAFRCRIALQAYAYTKNPDYLEMVINDGKSIINSGKYQLTANYGSMFNEEDPQSSEIILARYYLDKDATVSSFDEMIHVIPYLPADEVKKGSANGINTFNPNKQTFAGWAVYWPTQDLVDQYLAIDSRTGEAKKWNETSQFIENVEQLNTTNLTKGAIETFTRNDGEIRFLPSNQDLSSGRTDYPIVKWNLKVKQGRTEDISDIIYQNRDKRLDATIVRDKSTWINENISTNIGGNASQGIRTKEDGGWYTTTTGYYWKKNTVKPDPNAYSLVKINFHYVVARLGEVYMNMAEAYLLKNDYNKAVEALNMTRVKHGGLPGSKAANIADAWQDYLRERRVEMAYESGDLYFSYLRWGKYGGFSNYNRHPNDVIKDLDSPVYKVSISSDRQKMLISQLTLLNSWSRKFTIKRYLFPIPQNEIDKRTADGIKDTQNPNW